MYAIRSLRYRRSQAIIARQHGSVAPFLALGLAGALMATAFALDSSFLIDNAAQLKRATDAAALAVGNEYVLDNRTSQQELQQLAFSYVHNNLGMDSELAKAITDDAITLTQTESDNEHVRFQVAIDYQPTSTLLNTGAEPVLVQSTAEVFSHPVEIALMLPNTLSEESADISALRRMGKKFAEELLQDSNQLWLSIVPYSQSVNIFDANDAGRIQRWARPGALTPIELTSLFRTGKISNLADMRFPDRRANLLCMYRGLAARQNFDWDEPPAGQFKIYYRHDLPENGSPGAPPVSWVGPNPDFGQANGTNDTRWIVADKGCPNAALLPLTNNQNEIDERLDEMSTRFNVNYAIAMSWAAAALSPQMRGATGWGDTRLPLDFDEDNSGKNTKIIIMLANTTGNWFDTDAYNFDADESSDGETGTDGSRQFAQQRFIDLCNSFRQRNLKFHFIGVRPGDPADFGRQLFDQIAGPGLEVCAEDGGSMQFADATNFAEGRPQIESLLDNIIKDIARTNYVRLVE